MNFTNADYFTFSVDNSMLLVGMTGTGKSVLEDTLISRMIVSHKPSDLQFVILDMTGVDFEQIREKAEYVMKDIKFDAEVGLETLDEVSNIAEARISSGITKPLIFVLIEECNMSVHDQKKFDKAVIQINEYAKQANLKLVYSTSRIAEDTISKRLLDSFDLLLVAPLYSNHDYKLLGIEAPANHENYTFIVHQNKLAHTR